MAGSAQLQELLDATHAGPVFGEGVAFGSLDTEQRQLIADQTAYVMADAGVAVAATLERALPDKDADFIEQNVAQVITKTGAFFAALAAGELRTDDDLDDLSLVCQAGAYMYLGDQLTDRGDEPMRLAIELINGDRPVVPAEHRAAMAARLAITQGMDSAIAHFAGLDAGAIQKCYGKRVLHKEVRLQRLSGQYALLDADTRRRDFLRVHANTIADLMVGDAGFETVTTSLHSIYAKHDRTLPSAADILFHPQVGRVIRICDAVARVADERGDWWMDGGNDPRYGEFSINPLNQFHPDIVNRLCRLADIHDPAQITKITELFEGFALSRSDAERTAYGEAVTNQFFDVMRRAVNGLDENMLVAAPYRRHTQLCRRVGEISFINMRGDIALSGENAA